MRSSEANRAHATTSVPTKTDTPLPLAQDHSHAPHHNIFTTASEQTTAPPRHHVQSRGNRQPPIHICTQQYRTALCNIGHRSLKLYHLKLHPPPHCRGWPKGVNRMHGANKFQWPNTGEEGQRAWYKTRSITCVHRVGEHVRYCGRRRPCYQLPMQILVCARMRVCAHEHTCARV